MSAFENFLSYNEPVNILVRFRFLYYHNYYNYSNSMNKTSPSDVSHLTTTVYVLSSMCNSYYMSLVYKGRIWHFDRQLDMINHEAQLKAFNRLAVRQECLSTLITFLSEHIWIKWKQNKYWFSASYIFLTNIQSTLLRNHRLFTALGIRW